MVAINHMEIRIPGIFAGIDLFCIVIGNHNDFAIGDRNNRIGAIAARTRPDIYPFMMGRVGAAIT